MNNDKKIEEQKLYLEQKYSEIKATLTFSKKEYESMNFFMEGLGEIINEELLFEKVQKETINQEKEKKTISIKNMYTRQKYIDQNISFFLRLQGDELLSILILTKYQNYTLEEQVAGEQTIPIQLEYLTQNETITVIAKGMDQQVNETFTFSLQERESKQIDRIEPQVNLTKPTQPLTGKVVEQTIYTSKNDKITFILLLSSILAILIILFLKYKNTIFNRFIKQT